jgi:NCS1 family nucleobase:cation symporter-1
MVAQLGGVDISWIVGLVVPGILYYLLARKSAVVLPAVRSTKA